MKLAFIAVTKRGAALALKLREPFAATVFSKVETTPCARSFSSLAALTKEIFFQYDGLVFVMAAGIAVRMIAPYIGRKTHDPAVVVLDECGRHAVSLLSGHIGGANALAQAIAAQIGAEPVITTATDVNGCPAADLLAVRLGLRIENIASLKYVNGALAEGKRPALFIDAQLKDAARYRRLAAEEGFTAVLAAGEAELPAEMPALLLAAEGNDWMTRGHILRLRVGRLIAGVGCRRGVSGADILAALEKSCQSIGKSLQDIKAIASTAVKSDEPGLLETARGLNVPFICYENQQLQSAVERYHLEISAFVEKQIGVGNICESAALTASQSKKLALRKIRYPRITVALAWEK